MSSSTAVALLSESTDDRRQTTAERAPVDRPLSSVDSPRYRPALAMPTPEEIAGLKAYGEMIVQSKLFGDKVASWQAAVMIVRYGQALQIDEFTALTQIYWIKNVPTCSAQLMLSLILRDHGDQAVVPVEMTPEVCRLACRRRGWPAPVEVAYTIEEAKQAKLLGKEGSNWVNYPGDMLYARAVSRAGRRLFADTLRGLYTPEEIEGGEVVEANRYSVRAVVADPPTPPRPEPKPEPRPEPEPQPEPEPEPSSESPVASRMPSRASQDARRAAEARGLQNAVLAAFNLSGEPGKQKAAEIAAELLRHRWWVDETAGLTAAQIGEVREAVNRWGRLHAKNGREWLDMVGSATTETMLVDVSTAIHEGQATDPLILAALKLRAERLEASVSIDG